MSLKSAYNNHVLDFTPCVKISGTISPEFQAGVEYYGNTGHLNKPEAPSQQQHQLFAVSDWNLSPLWEFNVGVGIGLTHSVDALIFKIIIGRQIDWSKKKVQ